MAQAENVEGRNLSARRYDERRDVPALSFVEVSRDISNMQRAKNGIFTSARGLRVAFCIFSSVEKWTVEMGCVSGSGLVGGESQCFNCTRKFIMAIDDGGVACRSTHGHGALHLWRGVNLCLLVSEVCSGGDEGATFVFGEIVQELVGMRACRS